MLLEQRKTGAESESECAHQSGIRPALETSYRRERPFVCDARLVAGRDNQMMDDQSIGGYMARVDAARFVARAEESRRIEAFLHPEAINRVLVIHGEAGIGKSTLLRHAARLGERGGYTVVWFDGADLRDGIDSVDAAFGPDGRPGADPPRLVLVDRFELLGARTAEVRRCLRRSLSESSRIAVASRRALDPGWRADGWEHVVDTIALAPLDDDEARALLRCRGWGDGDATDAAIQWAHGLPLALAARCETDPNPAATGTTPLPSLGRLLLDRVVADEVGGHDTEAIVVAAIAPMVDAAMLRAVLGDRHASTTMGWLRGLSFVEPVADRVRLHERLAAVLVAELRVSDRARERRLRLAIADHLHDRAVFGEPALIGELRLLVDDDTVRWGLGETDRDVVYPDIVRPGDREALAAFVREPLGEGWGRLQRWVDAGGEHVVVIRDRSGALVGFGTWATTTTFPDWAVDDDKLMSILEWARDHDDGNASLIMLDVFDFLGTVDGVVAPVVSVGNTAVMVRSGLGNPRRLYAEAPPDRTALEFMAALGFVDAMVVASGARTTRWMVTDHGPGGVIGATRGLVYRSCGVQAPTPGTLVHVRAALRSFHDTTALSANPLMEMLGTASADELRDHIRMAIDEAFGDSERERTMHDCLVHGHLLEGASHLSAQRALHLSRSAYFRWLAEATSRLSEELGRRISTQRD